MWLIGATVCLLAAPRIQLSVIAGWPHNALRHHWFMPISCHFRDCKVLLVTSLSHVSGTMASVLTFIYLPLLPRLVRRPPRLRFGSICFLVIKPLLQKGGFTRWRCPSVSPFVSSFVCRLTRVSRIGLALAARRARKQHPCGSSRPPTRVSRMFPPSWPPPRETYASGKGLFVGDAPRLLLRGNGYRCRSFWDFSQ